MTVLFLLLRFIVEVPALNANRRDPGGMPCSSASDLVIHCLQVSLLWDAKHKWVKCKTKPKTCHSRDAQPSRSTIRRSDEEHIRTTQTPLMNPQTHKQRILATETALERH